jgi:transaldolase
MFKSPLHEMTATTPTCLWNDSADPDDLAFAMEHGAVGATCNPVIAHSVLKARLSAWRPRIAALIAERPTATEDDIGWAAVEALSIDAARLLRPVFDAHRGRNGRLSIQTDPRFAWNTAAILSQATHFQTLAPNLIVKIPATRAGLPAIEDATAKGISINATVSFTVAQAVAVAEAVERGLTRCAAAGYDVERMGPVCTIMVGRVDDWLRVVTERQAIAIDPGHLEWGGIAVFKQAYRLYQERGYRTRLLAAAFRNPMHWSALVGGDVVISPPPPWLRRLAASDLPVVHAIDTPVSPAVVDELTRRFADFRLAADEHALAVADFDRFAPTRRTLRQFLAAGDELGALVRDVMVPNPDRE